MHLLGLMLEAVLRGAETSVTIGPTLVLIDVTRDTTGPDVLVDVDKSEFPSNLAFLEGGAIDSLDGLGVVMTPKKFYKAM